MKPQTQREGAVLIRQPPSFLRNKVAIVHQFIGSRQLALLIFILILVIVISQLSPNFLTARNFQTITRNMPELLLMTSGMSLVLITGGIDISAESILGIAAIVIGKALLAGCHPVLSAVAGIFVATCLCALNGFLIAYIKLPAIVVTLGTMYLWRSVIFLLVGGRWLSGIPRVLDPIVKTVVAGIVLPFYFSILIVLIMQFVYTFTAYGCHVRAIGTNEQASRLCGIAVNRKKFYAYVIFGVLLGIAAIFYVGKYRNVEMTVAQGMSLEALAAAIIGGTSVLGGSGNFIGCLLGVFFLLLLRNALVLLHVPSVWDNAVLGGLILCGFIVDLTMRYEKK